MKTLINRIAIGLAGIAAAAVISATPAQLDLPDMSWNSGIQPESVRQVADRNPGASDPSGVPPSAPSGVVRPPRFGPDHSWNS